MGPRRYVFTVCLSQEAGLGGSVKERVRRSLRLERGPDEERILETQKIVAPEPNEHQEGAPTQDRRRREGQGRDHRGLKLIIH